MRYLKLIAISLIVCAPLHMGKSCIYFPEPNPYTIMDPNLSGSQQYARFWYDPGHLYNIIVDVDSSYDHSSNEWERTLIDDWYNYTGKLIEKTSLKTSLFSDLPEPGKIKEDDVLYQWLKGKTAGQLYYKLMKLTPEVLAEPTGWNEISWSFKSNANQYGIELNTASLNNIIALSEQILKKNPDHFIKRRSAYQQLKIYHYANQPEKVKQVFTQYFNDKNHDGLYYSALFYYALAFEGLEEAKLLLDCFRNSIDKKIRITSIFKLELKEELLKSAITMQQKNDLLCIEALKNPELKTLENLESIAKTEPAHPFINVLLSREINKLEDHTLDFNKIFYEAEYNSYALPEYRNTSLINEYYQNLKKHSGNFNKLIKVLEKNGDPKNKKYFTILKAYSNILEGNHNEGLSIIKKLRATPLLPREILQIDAIEIVSQSMSSEIHSEAFENNFIALLTKLNKPSTNKFNKNIANILLAHINWMYFINNDYEHGALLSLITEPYFWYNPLPYANEHGNHDNMMAIIEDKNTHTSRFIKNLLFSNFSNLEKPKLKQKDVEELLLWTKLQWLMRRNRIDEAIECYAVIGVKLKDNQSIDNPFFVNFAGTYSYSDDNPRRILLKDALEQIRDLKAQLKTLTGDEYSKTAFLLGNAFLSFSNEGINYRMSYKTSDISIYKRNYPADMHDYYVSGIANQYYKMAWDKCTNAELGALITIQQGACKVKSDIYFSDSSYSNLWRYKSMVNPYKSRYTQKFGSARVLENYLSNCDNIRDYYKGMKEYRTMD